jgi:hypothetical protein
LRRVADEKAALEGELRAEVPAGVAGLPAEQLRHLATALASRRAAQYRAADAAIEEGLGFLPGVLRRVVRKALMG